MSREEEFAKRLCGVEDTAPINMTDSANWRNLLDAIDYAIETYEDE